MKLGPETKLDKRNKTTSKNFDEDVMSADCDVIVIFPIFSQFGPIRKPDSQRTLKVTFYLTKTENRTKNISNTALTLLL